MQLTLEVETKDQSMTAVLALVYSFLELGHFSSTAGSTKITTTLDGSKPLTAEQYAAYIAVPHVLELAPPAGA